MRFFNREKEIREILSILEFEPNFIYFIYGPINSGKTALINEVINKLDDKYVVFYINLRRYFISKYEDFIEVLFEEYEEDKDPIELVKGLIKDSSVLFGIPVPKNVLEVLLTKKEEKNVFRYITNILLELRKEGKKPIIILDELQKIGDLKINGFLIYELFNYFISLTKELHLSYVFCLSSDSLFIEKVYNEAMLNGRAKYLLVDDFDKETALKFMDFLAESILDKKLSNEEKELIYSYVGGKPVDIIYVIQELKIKNLKEILDYLLNDTTQKLSTFLEILNYSKPKIQIESETIELKKEEIIKALKLFKEKYEIDRKEIPTPIYIYLVKKNILFLDPIKGTLKPQSFLVWNAIKRVI
ncbi:ATPase [Methanocaldococcus infernus ME]|uniref:ATPase n=1 Tax=Methanocaldococcus infernus (strain DSM 11812 / JCM 15783 / ME) TaxID=573063 RepID=D5VR81_METIM|nr:ATP-binding protein [Methanocaldococcus infernus]ADG13084.1 ATPase [Methanocaldococcus infernus ME]